MNDCCENCYYSFVNAELKKNSDNHCVICGLLMLKGKVAVRRKDFRCGDWRIKMQALEAADVRPVKQCVEHHVKRGQWDFQGYQLFKCTSCKEIFTQNQLEAMQNHLNEEEWTFPNFCPNCGADMRGKNDG